jgi:transcription antitermination factor NusG
LAATGLECKGIESFLPSIRSRRKWSDRVKEIEQPLFPGYVFARFDARNRLPVLTTPAVVDVVGFGQRYVPVSETELHAIRLVLESKAKCEPSPFLRVGQQVVIESGPLAGVEGLLVEIKNTRRLVVSVSLLQRSVKVELDPEWVTSAPNFAMSQGLRLQA